jgi:hypothetical protein
MCFTYNKKDSDNFVQKNKNKQFVWMYKKVYQDDISGIYSQVYHHIWKIGINKSGSRLRYNTKRRHYTQINKAIHTYIGKVYDGAVCGSFYIRVKCYIKDFIGINYGNGCAVWRQVTLPKRYAKYCK